MSSSQTPATTTADRAERLQQLHAAAELLVLVNVWDVVSARVVADVPGTRAVATASHSIAASHGYADGEHILRDEMLAVVGRVVAAVDLPVTADLEAGYGDPGGTIGRAIDLGVVGANLEDRLDPVPEAVRAVQQAVRAAERSGVPFVLNARTDAYLLGGDRDPATVLADAIERGRAYLDAGASQVFVPGVQDEAAIAALVEALGPRRVNVMGMPGALPQATLQRLGVSRVSYGPMSQNVALTALAELAADLHGGGALPASTRRLN